MVRCRHSSELRATNPQYAVELESAVWLFLCAAIDLRHCHPLLHSILFPH